MEFKSFILIILGYVIATNGQGYYGDGPRGRTGNIPDHCPPRIRCFTNPCHRGLHNCPNYPNAVCINDDPCQPNCVGHYYIQRQRRLTPEECHGDPPQADCPAGGPQMQCFTNPCHNAVCPAYPEAECINDDPCEPHCVSHFYFNGQQLGPRDCYSRNRRRHRVSVRQN